MEDNKIRASKRSCMTDISNCEKLKEELGYWQFFYNWQRPHSALNGKTPSQVNS